MKKRLAYLIVLLMLVALVACNLPSAADATPTPLSIDAAFTAAAQTVEARLTSAAQTQAAAAPPITNTPLPPLPATASATPPAPPPALPTATPSLTPVVLPCDQAQFITDVTVPDGTNFSPGDTFTKTWRIKNIGTCSWTPSYTLFFASGNSMNGPSTIALSGNVNPGQSVDISINLTAPGTPDEYTGYWKLRNASGLAFTSIYVKINVGGGGGVFAVNHVNFTVTGACGGFHIKAAISTNGAGTVTYHWLRSDGATDGATHDPLVFAAAGTQAVTTGWAVSAAGNFWMDIYIDTPNHQQFGRASFSCP